MPRTSKPKINNKKAVKAVNTKAATTTVRETKTVNNSKNKNISFIERVQSDLQQNQSYLNIILGALVVLVFGVLLFNFFSNRTVSNNVLDQALGPSQQTEQKASPAPEQPQQDVSKDNLPGKYTVKKGDTLFLIAQKYYGDGYKFSDIADANRLGDPNILEVGQVLNIPKLNSTAVLGAAASPTPVPSPTDNVNKTANHTPTSAQGTGGSENMTIWGERITGDTYTVQAGDWLSKIAGRAYGDIMQYTKIAQANNITNPDTIEPGTVLKIPR